MRFALLFLLIASPCLAGDLDDVVEGIEFRYNRLATLQTDFEQTMTYAGARRMTEKGRLLLRRPGKMRWDYEQPEGKLLVGDGELIRMFNPLTNQVRTVRVEETADMRAPLSFLLGRLRLQRQFKNLRLETLDGEEALVGEGSTGREAYTTVEFYYSPEYQLRKIRVHGRDDSVTMFRFDNETLNETLDLELFNFQTPIGAEILPETKLGGAQ